MLDWLKEILGDAYTEDIDKKISERIGKDFVSRVDFNTTNETKKNLESQLRDRDSQLEDLKKIDVNDLKNKIAQLESENRTSKENSDRQIEAIKRDWAIEKYFEGFAFTSDLAKSAAIQQFKEKEFKFEDGKFLGAEEFMIDLKEKNPTAFESEESERKPIVSRPTGQKRKPDEKMSLMDAMKYKNEHPEIDINDLI